jgi:hypothetical protein
MKMNYVVPALPQPIRLSFFGIFIIAGVSYQYFIPNANWFLGWLIMCAGAMFIIAKDFFNKPLDLGFEDWQPASKTEFNRINDNLTMTNKAKYPFYFRKEVAIGIIIVIVFIVILLLVIPDTPNGKLILAILDAGIILIPVFISGSIRLWMPQDLKLKMESFNIIMKEAEKAGDKLIVTPYIRLDKDKAGKRIPEDVRLMIEPKRKPDEFVGTQIQVAINNGPNGAVPYMYAVLLCKGKGRLFDMLQKQSYGNMVTEPGGDKDYGYIVIRQKTASGGYHTDAGDCMRLFELVAKTMQTVSAA